MTELVYKALKEPENVRIRRINITTIFAHCAVIPLNKGNVMAHTHIIRMIDIYQT